MDGMGLTYLEHLRTFLGESVADAELRSVALAAIAGDVRRLKLAIAGEVWSARQASGRPLESDAPDALGRARALGQRYRAAMEEYGRIRSGVAGGEAE